ncbi:MAG TPA: TlyA family RNA methyltransferase [Blastocatellia bacterium]|nr:TlyA family RNA methyltransferase [Blastocatellia bacterium]
MSSKSSKERLDKLLVARGLVETRAKAQALILAGQVYSGQQRLDKAGMLLPLDTELIIKEAMPYVSRGGLKLAAALDHFGIAVKGFHCLDVGASTGGFTDCLLQRGAAKVVALDVGHGQLAWKLRQDPRVEVREHANARFLQREDFTEQFDLAVCDVSFISLRLILPVLPPLLKPAGQIITLIKPQFEVGREEVGKGGIVRDEAAQQRVIQEIQVFATTIGLAARGVIDSPILGQEGNREFLSCFRLQDNA